MLYDTPGTLSDDEVYALVAWLLNQNGIIQEQPIKDAGIELLAPVSRAARGEGGGCALP
jgi:hypothetical protein